VTDEPGDLENPPRRSVPTQRASVHESTRWSTIGRGGAQGVRFLSSVVIFRLLGPENTGLMQMALVVTGFLDQFRDIGTGLAVVQRRQIDQGFISSIFVLNLLIGMLLSIVLFFGAGAIASGFGDPRLAAILRVVGPVFSISCLYFVPACQESDCYQKVVPGQRLTLWKPVPKSLHH
jgi:O-antigen/teichoic acid export membrane protein